VGRLTILTLCCTIFLCGTLEGTDTVPKRAWIVSTPEAEGLDPGPLEEATQLIRNQEFKNIHGMVIVRNGKLVYEAYFSGQDGRRGVIDFDQTKLHGLRSVTKSVTSTLIGIAIDRGLIKSVDEPIAQYFPDYKKLTEQKSDITIKHLLTMRAGIAWDQSGKKPHEEENEGQMENSDDFIGYVLSQGMFEEPGARFNYNSGCTILLAGIIKQASGMHVDVFSRKYLFEPLGIEDQRWLFTETGLPQTHFGLLLRPRDAAKIGQLYVDEGQWRGKQVVPAEWIKESVNPHFGNKRYGYSWWLDQFVVNKQPVKLYAAEGSGGQFIFAIPAIDLVVVFTGGNYGSKATYQPYKILSRFLLPAVQASQ
jgi:CubicO group peptidase (beta-lactamase class C family)